MEHGEAHVLVQRSHEPIIEWERGQRLTSLTAEALDGVERLQPPVVDVGVGVENSGVGGPARGSGVRDTEVMDDAGNARLAGALTVW